jgi:hypothetical protein
VRNGKYEKDDPDKIEAERLSDEVREDRREIGALVDELERRRRELLDWRLQMRRHRVLVATVALLACASLGLTIWRVRRAATPRGRVLRFRRRLADVVRGREDRVDAGARATGRASGALAGRLFGRILGGAG